MSSSVTESRHYLNQPNPAPLDLDPSRPVHFIGAGGIGMSALAKILMESGFTVSGSDLQPNAYLATLQEIGGTFTTPHKAENVPQNAVVITSSAIDTENPEVQQARAYGLETYHRSDLLRELMKRYPVSIGLTGTHGKTTMTGMTGLVLEAGDLDPTIIAGGKIPLLKTNAKTGKAQKYIVAELDESDGTVTQYQPTYSVISNLELDHPDHFTDGLEAIRQVFYTYLQQMNRDNFVIFNMDCPETAALHDRFERHISPIKAYPSNPPNLRDMDTYWLSDPQLHAEGGYQGDFFVGHERLGTLWLQVPGLHNLHNAMFAAIIGHRLGIPFDTIRRALENFTGMGRRFEMLGQFNKARIVDDYAHHPTEVKVTLKAAQEFNRHQGRVIAVFQPHRYGRLQALWQEFLEAFDDADEVIVLDVYAAGEAPLDGINGRSFVEALNHPAVEYWPSVDWSLVQARLKSMLTPDDLVLTLGAGDITYLGRNVVKDA